jgi:hypothetical protein
MVLDMDETEASGAAATWDRKVQSDCLRCHACAMTIPYASCDTYYRTGMCGYCAHHVRSMMPASGSLVRARIDVGTFRSLFFSVSS